MPILPKPNPANPNKVNKSCLGSLTIAIALYFQIAIHVADMYSVAPQFSLCSQSQSLMSRTQEWKLRSAGGGGGADSEAGSEGKGKGRPVKVPRSAACG